MEIISKLRSKTIHISSLLNRYFDRLRLSACDLKVSYHNPCHLKIQDDPQSSFQLLTRIEGMSVQDLNSHCCGMAGSWGLTADHYDLSRKIGSEMIAGLNNSDSVAGVTDCPTCRMQMEHLSDKDIMHPIEVVAKCLAF
jgi:Fe-S oxidoreductase